MTGTHPRKPLRWTSGRCAPKTDQSRDCAFVIRAEDFGYTVYHSSLCLDIRLYDCRMIVDANISFAYPIDQELSAQSTLTPRYQNDILGLISLDEVVFYQIDEFVVLWLLFELFENFQVKGIVAWCETCERLSFFQFTDDSAHFQ